MMELLLREISSHLSRTNAGGVNSESHIANQGPGNMPVQMGEADRRQDRRQWCLEACKYELVESEETVTGVPQRGEAYTVNQSVDGLMLLMTQAPKSKQYLEVHTTESHWRHAMTVCEVSWTRPIHIESKGDFYMVGCHRVMGPCRYLQF